MKAVEALSKALAAGSPDAAGSALLAGVLQDVGQLRAARATAADAVSAAVRPEEEVLALDVFAGVLLVLGDLDSAREPIGTLERIAMPAAQIAAAFRSARLDRLDGMLDRAIGRLVGVVSGLPAADRRFAAPRAAALHEVAELRLLSGDLAGARTSLAAARAAWARSGRRPGGYAAEGLALRLHLAEGTSLVPSLVDRGIAFAHDRGLVLLGAELRIARGRVRAAQDLAGASEDFDAAVEQARTSEARLLEGRARLWRRVAGCPAADGDLERAKLLLSCDRVLLRHPVLWRTSRN